MTTRANLYVDQGTDFLATLELESDDGSSYPIDQQDFFCQVRKVYSSEAFFDVDLEVVSENATNELSFYIKPEDTRDIPPGKYQYDLIMKKDSEETIKLLEGLMFILPTVTKIE